MKRGSWHLSCLLMAIVSGSGCVSYNYHYREANYDRRVEKWKVLQGLQLDSLLEDKILALHPEQITEKDIKEVLSRGPAPRIINLHGGLPLVYQAMDSYAKFLTAMGYPEGKIRNPRDGTYSYSPFKSSAELAGIIAWYYEKEGMPVMLVGHSAGGMQTVRVLYELAGAFADKVAAWNPLTEEAEGRYSIIDPLTGVERPVVGLRVGYATAVGVGGLASLFPNSWSMLGRFRRIPDTVEHFTGFYIVLDFIAGDFLGLVGPANKYRANGTAKVHNVKLPPSYFHATVPATEHLSRHKRTRDWINTYVPTEEPELSVTFDTSSSNILWAADVWHSVKKQWCLEVQRLIRAKRNMKSDL